MKKIALLVLLIFGCWQCVVAQDIIVKTDATQIKAKVAEITPAEIRYKKFTNPDGPTYVLPVSDIHYILYPNGEKEMFTAPTSESSQSVASEGVEHRHKSPLLVVGPGPVMNPPTPTQESATPVPIAEASPVQYNPALERASGPVYIIKTYELGDVYNENGVKGLVCKVSEDKQHGLIISMDELYLRWSEFEKPNLRLTGAEDRVDGEANMRTIEQYIAKNSLSWDDFPAFKWCREQGEGWYFPSIDEVLQMGHAYNGGTRMINNRQMRTKFNDNLKDNGGKRMDRLVPYFSSTELDEKSAYSTHMTIEPPYVIDIHKNSKFIVRAMHKF